MSQLFSTELLPAGDRIDAWQWNAQQICGNCRFELPRTSFHGSIEVRELGILRLTRFSSSPLAFWKWPLSSSSSENRSCIVITQIAGQRRYSQNGAEVLLRSGDSTVINAAEPWSSTCATECARLYLRVPLWMMENRLQTGDIPVAQRIPGDSRMGAALSKISQYLYDQAGQMESAESQATLDTYFETLAECVGVRPTCVEPGARLRTQVLRYIETHLADPTLAPPDIAANFGISLRHLHRVFNRTGNSVSEYVRLRRLDRCRQELADTRLENKSITEIAFSWGFSDAAHFSHSFRKQFGLSPRAFRESGGSGIETPNARLRDFAREEHLPRNSFRLN